MTYTQTIIICPAAAIPDAQDFCELQGWTRQELSVPLSATGADPATHWGCCAPTSETALSVIAAGAPEACVVSVVPDGVTPLAHFLAEAGALGLVMREPDPPA